MHAFPRQLSDCRGRAAPRRRAARPALLALQALVVALPLACPASAAAAGLAELPRRWHDDRGQAFDLNTLQGRSVILTMAYATCHRVCPMTMRRLLEVQNDYDRRGAHAEFLVIGYDPDTDDAAAWHQYRKTRHLTRDNWHFLIGTRADVEQTARQLGFPFWKYDEHVIHDLRILYFNEHGSLVASAETSELERTQR
jgi:cytochrome oxidase Cu insertion factor (SCO1/SenC/PrrC family)